jgi:peptidoglycan/LPS O-acetylase OafA/YrhL
VNFDDVQELWRSQDARPSYSLDEYLLRSVVGQRHKSLTRLFFWKELVPAYSATLFMLAMAAFLFLIMYFDDDPRTGLDFVLPFAGAGTILIWLAIVQVDQERRKRLEPRFTAPMREGLERDIERVDHEISVTRRPLRVMLVYGLLGVSTVFVGWASWQVNNEPPEVWFIVVTAILPIFAALDGLRVNRRLVQRELYPRKRELEFLRDKLAS